MRSKQLFRVALIALALMPTAVVAQGTFSLGRSFSELSESDREAIKHARIEVLDKMQLGSVSFWNDDTTGHSGGVKLSRIYEKNGMTCGDLEFVFNVPEMRRLRIAFCRIADGDWRILG
jgi:hypothetical protein